MYQTCPTKDIIYKWFQAFLGKSIQQVPVESGPLREIPGLGIHRIFVSPVDFAWLSGKKWKTY